MKYQQSPKYLPIIAIIASNKAFMVITILIIKEQLQHDGRKMLSIDNKVITKKPKGGFSAELPDSGFDLEDWIDKIVLLALEKNEWNQSRTAKYMSVSRNTLIYRMEKRGLKFKS